MRSAVFGTVLWSVHRLGELRPGELLQAVVESLDRPALPPQSAAAEMPEPPLPQPPQHRLPLGEQREVPYVVAQFAQPSHRLGEVAGVGDGHRRDHHALAPGQGEVEDLHDALPPGLQVLEVAAQFTRQHALEAEAGLLGIADDAARQTAPYLVCGLCLAAPEGAVDPQEHARHPTGGRDAAQPCPPARTRPVS
ncbi:hypothetical protein GCM10010233_16620 [Streptomyces pseudogriseolus]|nr:hypothetical protein GCM10010233_16620 [Streptomyces gancidicus]